MQAVFSLVFLAIVALSQGASIQDTVTSVAKKCATETKVTPEQAKIAFNKEIPKTEEENCYMECIYSGVDAIKDKKFQPETAKKLAAQRFTDDAQKKAANQLIDTCAKEAKPGSEKCGLGKALRVCFSTHGKDVSFFS